jgi:hypothetical protein
MQYRFLLFFSITLSSVSFSQTEILNEDFQAGMPATWTIVDNDGHTPAEEVSEYTQAWILKANPEDATDSVASSTSYFDSLGFCASRWLITPPLALGAFGNTVSWNGKSHDPSFPDHYRVYVSTTGTAIADFTTQIAQFQLENPEWTAHTASISHFGFNNQTIYLAFANISCDAYKLYIDDVKVVKEDPAGIDETNLLTAALYPNPAQNNFRIQSSGKINRVDILGLDGKSVRSVSYTNDQSIDVSDLVSGIYLVKVQSGQAYKTFRLVKN